MRSWNAMDDLEDLLQSRIAWVEKKDEDFRYVLSLEVMAGQLQILEYQNCAVPVGVENPVVW